MQELLRVKAAYDQVDALLQDRIGVAISAQDAVAEAALERVKEVSDYAYFVVLFSQFERIVKAKFREARDRRRANADWSQRRGWDGDVFTSRNLAFSTQLAAVLDRTRPEYQQVIVFYEQRNHIAHGGLTPSVGSVEVFVREISTVINLLRS